MTQLASDVLPFRKVVSTSCVSQLRVNMPSAELWFSLRERLLDIVSGSDRARSLNPSTDPSLRSGFQFRTSQITGPNVDSIDEGPATELIELLHEVLSSELADHGATLDYSALRQSPLYDDFRQCAGKLRTFNPSALPDRNAQLAFWINLYNTLVLDAVIALGIQRSITEQRAGLTFLRQAAYIVGGQRMSCDDIEHGILRANRGHPFFPGKQFHSSDPRLKWVIEPFDKRIHFALNCASRSCPPIRAYAPEKLDSQLDLATRSYLATDHTRAECALSLVHLQMVCSRFWRT
jgi:hypothetical protein